MTNGLMKGRRGLIMGVANDHSIAWGIAKALHAQGAELAFTYQGEAFGRRVKPLAEKVGSKLVIPCDVEDLATVDAVFAALGKAWGAIDFVVHAIAFSDKTELKGKYADTSRDNFIRTMIISCFSFTEIAQARRGPDAERRFARDPHLWRLDARHAELQCHGRRQGGARILGALSRRRLSARKGSG